MIVIHVYAQCILSSVYHLELLIKACWTLVHMHKLVHNFNAIHINLG